MAERKPTVNVVSIVRHTGAINFPPELSDKAIMDSVEAYIKRQVEPLDFESEINCFPVDGQLAVQQAIDEQFGVISMEPEHTMFGDINPKSRQVEVAPGVTKNVPEGWFKLPGIEALVGTGYARKGGRLIFKLQVKTLRKYEEKMRALESRIREIALGKSIYQGKVLEVRFRYTPGSVDPNGVDRSGTLMPEPEIKFVVPSTIQPTFSASVERRIDNYVINRIIYWRELEAMGIPFKRGILLAGQFGTGKTMLASYVASLAEKHGITFAYFPDKGDIDLGLRLMENLEPGIPFFEDVDREAGLERTDQVNALANTLDGIGNKKARIFSLFTSNNPRDINPMLRRPGRIDRFIEIPAPDAEACARLMRFYGNGLVRDDEDITEAGEILAGQIPAVVREAVEDSQVAAVARLRGAKPGFLIGADLSVAAEALLAERKLFETSDETDPSPAHAAGEAIEALIKSSVAIDE